MHAPARRSTSRNLCRRRCPPHAGFLQCAVTAGGRHGTCHLGAQPAHHVGRDGGRASCLLHQAQRHRRMDGCLDGRALVAGTAPSAQGPTSAHSVLQRPRRSSAGGGAGALGVRHARPPGDATQRECWTATRVAAFHRYYCNPICNTALGTEMYIVELRTAMPAGRLMMVGRSPAAKP